MTHNPIAVFGHKGTFRAFREMTSKHDTKFNLVLIESLDQIYGRYSSYILLDDWRTAYKHHNPDRLLECVKTRVR